ncbi:cell division control protein 1 isoform X2 [Folsomia candida]|uniref:cell division control protein 1 isoform X2 n=1 Tax=Folsomia candida TaxID=158441 RepID=UPI000B8F55F4|nr:cell division control protein 1 isoform X2 [Folsomia candida]
MTRRVSRKCKGICSFVLVVLLVFYIEVLSYIVNTQDWTPFPTRSPQQKENGDDGPLRVLVVADPQIIGENNELAFFGLFTRWDADRYLHRNFLLAQHHTQPHVVAFLGDLFDEGYGATDAEYRRYTRRFREVFQLPRKQDPSPIEYVFLPGDNDIGGEGVEPIDVVKLRWFNQTFGDFKKELWVQRGSVSAQFVKLNLLLPEEYQNPTKGREHLLNGAQPDVRIILSHTSLVQFKTNAVQTILDQLRPQLIFSAHSHHSAYTQLEGSEMVKMTDKFLMAHKHPSRQWALEGVPFLGYTAKPKSEITADDTLQLQTSATITLQFDKGSRTVHEITVPTCSYRMGTPHPGFGAFHLYKNGTLEYTVLWLPSRLNQLYTYLGIYLIMKFSVIFWALFKAASYIASQVKNKTNFFILSSGKNSYHKV